ncbi:hypothetical protein AWV79_32970 [Cupriavidus sp. UYMMa02A]|nr:hypothetical protein AWV79_32970 [Cupriavidus sp. UYMMa02A]
MLGRGSGLVADLPAGFEYHAVMDLRGAEMQHPVDPAFAPAYHFGAVQAQHEQFGRLGAQDQPLPELVGRERIQLKIAWIVDLYQVLETQLNSPCSDVVDIMRCLPCSSVPFHCAAQHPRHASPEPSACH